MRGLQHVQLVVLDHVHERSVPVHPFFGEVRTVFGRSLLQPHVVVDVRGDLVAPPVVPEFMAVKALVLQGALPVHEARVGDIGGVLHGPIGGVHIADATVRLWSVPMFQCIDGTFKVAEFGHHAGQAGGARGQCNGHGAVHARMHPRGVLVIGCRDGRDMGGNGVVHLERTDHGVATEQHLAHQIALAMCSAAVRAFHMVGVGRPFNETVEARVPDLTEVGGDRGKPDAQVVDDVAFEIEAAPGGVPVRSTVVVHGDVVVGADERLCREQHLQDRSVVFEDEGSIGIGNGIDGQLEQIEPNGTQTR